MLINLSPVLLVSCDTLYEFEVENIQERLY